MSRDAQPAGCKRVFELLSEYLDQELPPETCEKIRAHLEGCPPCIAFVESLKRSVELCRQYGSLEKPGPIPESVRAELKAAYERSLAAPPPRGSDE